MMRLFILTLVLFIASNCEVKTRDVKGLPKSYPINDVNGIGYNAAMVKTHIDGIEYHVYTLYDGGLFVVNHTKELMEVNALRKSVSP